MGRCFPGGPAGVSVQALLWLACGTSHAAPETEEVTRMPRLLSVSLTEPQVRAKAKTVTRRLGWWTDKRGRRMLRHGDRVTLCRKVMGRRLGEPLVRIVDVRVVDVRRERLD